jgi:PAS domain S-box-containing protein
MGNAVMMELIFNASLLLALGAVSYLFPIKWRKHAPVLTGIVTGIIAILVMTMPINLAPGIAIDTRTILIGLTALMFGLVPAAITSGMAIVYRIALGGVGILAGIIGMIVAPMIIGLLWRRMWLIKKVKHRWLNIYLFGVSIHLAMLAGAFLLPDPIAVLSKITLPVITISPVVTVLLGILLQRQKEKNEYLIRLREAEARYRSLFHNNQAVMMLFSPVDAQIVEVNPAACRFYGWTEEEFKRMKVTDINTLPSDKIAAEIENAVSGRRNDFNFIHRRASGDVVDVETFSGPITVGGQTLLYSIIHDVSERTAYQKALAESENRFRMLLEAAPDAMFVAIGPTIFFVNKAAVKLFGAESAGQLIGAPLMDRLHPDFKAIVTERIRILKGGGTVPPTDEVYIRMDGTPVEVEVMAVPLRYNDEVLMLAIARDITGRKRMENLRTEMEAYRRQQQKLEAVGTLAGGVAHEINNPIHGIMNYAELISDETDEADPRSVYAKEIIRETDRIAVIVKNLLQFSRHEKQTHSYASVYDIVGQTVSLINTVIKKDQIKLDIDMEEGLPDIKCRSQQIQQVLMNLLTNARDALNDKYPDYDENKVIGLGCRLFESSGRRWVRITVEDKGCGIPDDVRERMFEPFFSTKPKDKGTGLGLAISFGIVKDHHGKIDIETEPGEYTRFILELPVDNGWQL